MNRDAFEKWATDGRGFDIRHSRCEDNGNTYAYETTEYAWEAWQASRAQALEEAAKVCEETPVVTLPGYYSYDDGQRTLDNAAEAIRALAQGGT